VCYPVVGRRRTPLSASRATAAATQSVKITTPYGVVD
jgi:hypothetical protein